MLYSVACQSGRTGLGSAVADPEATLDMAGRQVGTDPNTEHSVPGARAVTRAAKRLGHPSRSPRWQDWRKLAAGGAGGLLPVWLSVWVVLRDKHGREVGRIARTVSSRSP